MMAPSRDVSIRSLSLSMVPFRRYWERYGVVTAFLAVLVVSSLVAPNFLSSGNFLNVLATMSFVLFVAYGQTLVIISGGMDLSQGSIVSLSCMA
ncbi:MAG: ABC transporter permease, partial [Deltaproteobacteria bacterium]|nr:ABC transporter permease [Deltaproteobacteria bacterium]